QIIDYVPFNEMPKWFAGARLFVSTGAADYEGFPNVLLQAAASRTPIISLEDFDDFLANSGAGVSCDGTTEHLVKAIQSHWKRDRIDWEQVERYLKAHHDHRQVAANVEKIVRELV